MRVLLTGFVCFCATIAFIFAQDAPKTGAIYGTVLSVKQEVVGDAKVEVLSGPSGVGIIAKSRGRDSVNYDGGFFIPHLRPGDYAIKVSHRKYTPRTYEGLQVTAGRGTYMAAELQPIEDIAGSISGSVTVRGASVEGLVVGYVEAGAKKPVQTLTLGKDGRYSFKGILPGAYNVVVTKDREEIYKSPPITVSKKKNTRHMVRLSPDALLEKPGWITGKVLGPDHKPVERASIALTKMPAGQKKVSARSGKDGKFEIKGLRPGSYELRASMARVGEDTAKTHVRSNRGSRVTFYLKEK